MEPGHQLMTLPEPEEIKHQIEAINKFQKVVHASLIEGLDYGVIPGTDKPTMLKPGAEKITKLLGLADTYEILDKQEDWSKPFFRYLIKCTLTAINGGFVVSEGMGECNSYESKYRYRDAKRKCPNCGKETIIKGKEEYGGGWLCWQKNGGCGAKFSAGDPAIENQAVGKVENEDIFSLVNTILKMGEKRSLIDAALHAGRLSDVFTQDMEDLKGIVNTDRNTQETKPSKPKPAPIQSDNAVAPNDLISTEQNKKLFATMKDTGYSKDDVKAHTLEKYGKSSSKDLTKKEAAELINDLANYQVARISQPVSEAQEELFPEDKEEG